MKNRSFRGRINFFSGLIFAFLPVVFFLVTSCASMRAASADEYFSLGMAYFDLGQAATDANTRLKYFQEADKWLNRARSVDKTKSASEYNLGRIAFETGRYQDAARYFESILKDDNQNVMALRAAAYTRIKTGDIDLAEALYNKLLTIVPESSDDGYNHALVLYTMGKYQDAEDVLSKYQYALLDNSDSLLLYARTQKALGKIEAADSYERWLTNNKDPKVRCEYAAVLETQEFYARALEEYRTALGDLADTSTDPKKSDVQFYIARLLLIANSDSNEGMTALEDARKAGFADTDQLDTLAQDTRVSAANIKSINAMIADIKQQAAAADQAAQAAQAAQAPASTDIQPPDTTPSDTSNTGTDTSDNQDAQAD